MRTLILLNASLALGACDLVGLGDREEPANLGGSSVAVHFVVPDTVIRGAAFQVEFAYYGSGSCTDLQHIGRQIDGNAAVLVPIVSRPRFGSCTADLHRFQASATLRFELSGTAEIGLRGRFDARDTTIVRATWVK